MRDLLVEYYLIFLTIHILAVISWMAGMLYLPRLFVYHTTVKPESQTSKLFKVMEKRLLRIIINPAMIVTFLTGSLLLYIWEDWSQGWIHAKIFFVLVMSGVHGMLAKYRKDFEQDRNVKSERFYRILNEVPAVLMVIIVILVVNKPF